MSGGKKMDEPIVLIATNRNNGKLVSVGLYEDVERARHHVFQGGQPRSLFSIWTPSLNQSLETPAVSGLSLPPMDYYTSTNFSKEG